MTPVTRLFAGISLALAATLSFAQAPRVVPENTGESTTIFPVLNNANGQVEAVLLVESPAADGRLSTIDRLLGRSPVLGAGLAFPLDHGNRLSATLSLDSNPGLGLSCEGNALRVLSSLNRNCLLTTLSPNTTLQAQPGLSAELRLDGDRGAVAGRIGTREVDLENAFTLPGRTGSLGTLGSLRLGGEDLQFDQDDIGLAGELKLGESGWVSIGGTWARARLVPTSQLPGGTLPAGWDSGTLSVGGGIGDFGGEVVGRVVEVPGEPGRFTNIGVGVTWRTPWQGQLSVGAENILSKGKNPFAPATGKDGAKDEERVPYVRYEQDL